MRKVIEAFVDEGSWLEIKKLFAKEILTGFARLDGQAIGVAPLSAKLTAARGLAAEGPVAAPPPSASLSQLREARTAFEVQFISKVLAEHGRNVSRAARALGISRVALQKKMKEYGLR